MKRRLLSLHGLKWNPFSPAGRGAIHHAARRKLLLARRRASGPRRRLRPDRRGTGHRQERGSALACGPAGAQPRLGGRRSDPSNLADFYREMGELFDVPLRPHNRWGGFKVLRTRWQDHLEAIRLRPVLLIDEAQELQPAVLGELRLLAATEFDSRSILSVVLAGDTRLADKLQRSDLLPLESRIRQRLAMGYAERKELAACLDHLLEKAGNPRTQNLRDALCDHAAGNYRSLTKIADSLLATAAEREITELDEKLFFEIFTPDKRRGARS